MSVRMPSSILRLDCILNMSFPGMTPPPGGMPGTPGMSTQGMNEQEQAMVKTVSQALQHSRAALVLTHSQMQAAMESCPIKTGISGTMGFALGGVFGLFMASVRFLLSQPQPAKSDPSTN